MFCCRPLLKLQDIEMKINSGDILDFSDLENEILFVVSNAIMYQKISSPVYEMASNLRLEIKNYFQVCLTQLKQLNTCFPVLILYFFLVASR